MMLVWHKTRNLSWLRLQLCAALLGTASLSAAGAPGSPQAPAQGAYADLPEARLYYEIHGQGHPLLLLHGGLSSGADFAAILPELARRFRVIVVDRRGHGRSADTDAPFSYAQMADEIHSFLGFLRPGPASVIGFSDGGVVGYQLASKYPGDVTRLVAVGANYRVGGMSAEALEWVRHEATVAQMAQTQPEIEKRFRAIHPRPDAFPTLLAKSRELWLSDPYITEEAFRSIRVPVLLLAGEVDAVRQEHILEMRSLLPNGHLCIIPDSSHFVLTEKPALVLPILLDFLDR